jgi:hypothetical protein
MWTLWPIALLPLALRLAISGESNEFGTWLLFGFPLIGALAALALLRLHASKAARASAVVLIFLYALIPAILVGEDILGWLGLVP